MKILSDFAPPTYSYVYGKNNPAVNNRTFVVLGDSWAKDGKPFRILSGRRKIFFLFFFEINFFSFF